MQHGKVTRMWNQIMVKLGVLGIIPNGGFAMVVIKARLPDSFVGKEMKTKKVWLWLFQVKVFWKSTASNWTKNKFSLLKHSSETHVGLVVV